MIFYWLTVRKLWPSIYQRAVLSPPSMLRFRFRVLQRPPISPALGVIPRPTYPLDAADLQWVDGRCFILLDTDS